MHQHAQPSPGQSATNIPPHGDTPDAQPCVSSPERMKSDEFTTSVGQERPGHIAPLQHAMAAAFIRWHVTGCWVAAADYANARRDWEMALMEGRVA